MIYNCAKYRYLNVRLFLAAELQKCFHIAKNNIDLFYLLNSCTIDISQSVALFRPCEGGREGPTFLNILHRFQYYFFYKDLSEANISPKYLSSFFARSQFVWRLTFIIDSICWFVSPAFIR